MPRKQKYETDIQLGERYRDEQTGMEGIATAIFFFQHACERVQLERINSHNQQLEETVFDAPRLTHVGTGLRAVVARPGGPAREHHVRPGVVAR